jgi:hypothetical protein
MPSTKNQHPTQIIDYGIAFAPDFYTLSELVKSQIKKGFQPFNVVFQSQTDEGLHYCQALVKYASQQPAVKLRAITKQPILNNKKQNQK